MIAWASSGQVGFKGSRKSTPFAAQLAAEAAARQAQEHGMKKVDVFVKGPGSGRETAIRSLQATGLEVGSIQDVTPRRTTAAAPQAPPRLNSPIRRSRPDQSGPDPVVAGPVRQSPARADRDPGHHRVASYGGRSLRGNPKCSSHSAPP